MMLAYRYQLSWELSIEYIYNIIYRSMKYILRVAWFIKKNNNNLLYKGGIPAAPSGTATLLRLSPSY
jgi:hypothetical protein